jgi:hypothetical protein
VCDRYFLEDKLELLDAEEEWFYDVQGSKKVYVKLSGGISPVGRNIRGKVQDYAIRIIDGSEHIRIENLKMFATTVYASRSSVCVCMDARPWC